MTLLWFLIAKYISHGYFLQCRNSGQNPCLWQEEEKWHQRSECVGRASLLILRWLCSWQAPPPGPRALTMPILWYLAVRLFLLGVRRWLRVLCKEIQHLPRSPTTSGSHVPTRQITTSLLGFWILYNHPLSSMSWFPTFSPGLLL